MVETKIDANNLKKEGVVARTGFSVSTYDTEENRAVHNEFLAFCKEQADDNRTVALKILLDIAREDYKYAALFELIEDLRERVTIIESEPKTKTEDKKSKVF